MGSDPAAAYPPDPDETPRRTVTLEPLRLARTPVTNVQYRAFAKASGRPGPPTVAADELPVTYVSHADPLGFCDWASVRLPTEDEWEAAARGCDDRLWPWGVEPPSPGRAVYAGPIGGVEPVGSRPHGASAHGVLDLAGNVCEWLADSDVVRGGCYVDGPNDLRCSHRMPIPYDPSDGREEPAGPVERVLRGGSFASPNLDFAQCARRSRSRPERRRRHTGFRVARGGRS
jgi:formylglycine-generating enzyme required for sulfatase activity